MSFHDSSQRKFFLYESQKEIDDLRSKVNAETRSHLKKHFGNNDESFLSVEEEGVLWKHFAIKLQEICGVFDPPFPPEVVVCRVVIKIIVWHFGKY